MTERERVIKALGFCLMPPSIEELENDICSHEDCPYYREYNGGKCVSTVAKDALALLKAQEPRLVEPNDFENADDYNWLPAWCEERTGAGYWEMILPDALDEKDVRYWTGRPTDEQRAKEPWNGQA